MKHRSNSRTPGQSAGRLATKKPSRIRLIRTSLVIALCQTASAFAHPGHDHAGLDEFHRPIQVPSLAPWHHALALVALGVLVHTIYRSRRPLTVRLTGAAVTVAVAALWMGAR